MGEEALGLSLGLRLPDEVGCASCEPNAAGNVGLRP